MINIFAYTETEGYKYYPAYLSINIVDKDTDEIEITVRAKEGPNGLCGNTASIRLNSALFSKLARTLFAYKCTGAA